MKNCFELYEGGFEAAIKDFDKAYTLAVEFPYGSLAQYYGKIAMPIVDKSLFLEIFSSPNNYKSFAKECLLGLENHLGELTLEGL